MAAATWRQVNAAFAYVVLGPGYTLGDRCPQLSQDRFSAARFRNCSTSAIPFTSRSTMTLIGARPENGAERMRRCNHSGPSPTACSAASISGR